MAVDHSFQIIEALLTAKKYKSREELISTSELIVKVVSSLGSLSRDWALSFKEALNKLNSLSFEEMNRITDILNSEEDEEDAGDKTAFFGDDGGSERISANSGETEYLKGKEYYAMQQYKYAAVFFKSAASKGNAKAGYNYAICLYTGRGVTEDRVEAIKRFVLASKEGISSADRMLRYIAYGGEENENRY